MPVAKKVVKAAAKKPVVKKPAAKKPVAKKAPATKKAVVKKPAAKKPVAKTPVKKVAVKKPVAKKPVAKTPVKKVAVKKPVAKKPVVKKPIAKSTTKKTTKTIMKPVKSPIKKAVTKTPVKAVEKKSVAKKPVVASAKTTVKKPVSAPAKVPAKVTPPLLKESKPKPAEKPIVSVVLETPVVASVKIEPVAKKSAKKPVVTPKSDSSLKIEEVTFTQLSIKNNLADLMPSYDRAEEKIDDDYMNESKKLYFREALHVWKKQLMEEVDRTVDHMKDESGNFPDPADRATQEEEFNLELRTRDRERKLIKKIDETLQRLDDDEYGYCEACGIEIGYKRLEARPTATLCIDCKTVDEIRERQLAAS